MRFVTRMAAGLGTAAVLTAGVAATAGAANAATAGAPVKAQTSTTAEWGPYFSADHKAKAAGEVVVSYEKIKVGHWKTWYTWELKCWKHDGKKFCEKYKQPHKKWVFTWVTVKNYTVHSTLWNFKWYPTKWKQRCAWETFKVLHTDGKVTFHSFNNCHKGPQDFSFDVKHVDKIWVNVARGNHFKPVAQHSGWTEIV
ncbi:hypothetical protein AB0K60_36515 [Thermopolyspora sp. NPDC052614]|uniref:hypothetical protein n=1 Tax=Thermopolyspora sp. NPDC052614 TaxID=3155682 RepID=UPI00342008AF